MTIRVLAFAAALVLTACHEVVSFVLPEAPDGANAAIIFYEDERGGGEAFAFPPGAPPARFAGVATAIDVLYYDATLDALGLRPGRLESATEPNRPLPKSALIYRAEAAALESFAPSAERSPALADKRIAALDIDACFAREGCYESPAAAEEDDCALPCPLDQPAPLEPQPPGFETCPPGWRTKMIEQYAVCEPPGRLAADCPLGQVQPIDSDRCVPIGTACSASEAWNVDLAARPGRIHYVREGAPAGGIGTRGAPFATFAEATELARSGDTIALSKGRFFGLINVPAGVEVIGACVDETVLDGQRATAILAHNSGAKISTLRIENSMLGAELAGDVRIEDVLFSGTLGEGAGAVGVEIASGAVVLERVVLRGFENAITNRSQAAVAISRAVISDSGNAAIASSSRGDLLIDDTVIARGRRRAIEASAPTSSTRIHLTRIYFYEHQEQTINLQTATAKIQDAVIRDTALVGPFGNAIYYAFGTIEVSRAVIERHAHAAVWFNEANALVSDAVISDIRGHAFDLQNSETRLERIGVLDPDNAILIVGSGSATATDLAVDITRDDILLIFHPGAVTIDPGTRFSGERVRMSGAPEASISVALGATLELRDAVLRGSKSGVDIYSASATIENSIIQDMLKNGVGVFRDSIGGLADPVLRLDGFVIENCGDAGLDVASGGIRIIKNGTSRRNTLGARVDFDPKTIFEKVKVLNNRTAFDILPP